MGEAECEWSQKTLMEESVLGNYNGKWASVFSVLLFNGLKIASGFHINNFDDWF